MKLILIILVLTYWKASSQSNMISSGESFLTNEGGISSSVGQVFTNFVNTENYTLQEGVQHPYEIHDVVSTSDHIQVAVKIWPNPFKNDIIVNLTYENIDELTYVFSTITGQNIYHGQLRSTNNISTHDLPNGIYVFSIFYKNQFLSTYKLIKQ